MKPFLIACVSTTFSILTSCSSVQTVTAVSEVTEKSLQEDLAGTWKLDDGIFNVAFNKKGIGHFATTYWEDDEFKTDFGVLNAVRKSENSDLGFLSLKLKVDDVPEDELTFHFFAFKVLDDENVLIWEPDPLEAYERFIENDELKGTVEGKDHQKSITFENGTKLREKVDNFSKFFDLEDPKVISRALPKEEPEAPAED